MVEHDNGMIAFLFELKPDPGANPFGGSVDHLPQHTRVGLKLEHLHLEAANVVAAGAEAELQGPADFAFSLRVGSPPTGQAFTGGHGFVHLVKGCLHTDSV